MLAWNAEHPLAWALRWPHVCRSALLLQTVPSGLSSVLAIDSIDQENQRNTRRIAWQPHFHCPHQGRTEADCALSVVLSAVPPLSLILAD